jgi:hypothetical protein
MTASANGRPDRTAYTLPETAEMLCVSTKTVEAWVRTGQLPAIDVSRDPSPQRRRLRVTSEALQTFLDRRAVGGEKPPSPPLRRRRPAATSRPRQWV